MRTLLKIFTLFGGSILLVLTHTILVDLLPYPFNFLNITYIGLVWWLMYDSTHETRAAILTVAFLTELYASTPFGVVLFAFVASLLITDWMLRTILTNHSWYMVFLAGILSLSLYHALYIFILILLASFFHSGFAPNQKIIIVTMGEVLLSSLALMVLYFVSRLFTRKMNPRYISLS